MQKSVLKVNIHCDGCKHRVKKILQKIDGVHIKEVVSSAKKGVLVSILARQPLAVGRHEHGVALCYLLMLPSPGSIACVEADHQRWHEDLPS
ncbi:hypothetical protein K1719_014330 [Acacia pycnantha]|nr:hypothetical protein K1719_014330 [Acacia pycnantha]